MKFAFTFAIALAITGTFCNANAGVYTDDFNDGDADGWEEVDGSFNVVGGVYIVSSTEYWNDARTVIGSEEWSDYTIDVDFMIADGSSHASILFRIEEIDSGCDAGRYYQFHIFETSVGFCRMNYSDGFCTVLATGSAITSRNEWHHARLNVQGSSAEGSIDGTPVLSCSSLGDYSSGRVGLKAINGGTNRYDNVVIEGPLSAEDSLDIDQIGISLHCYPNPFNPATRIFWQQQYTAPATLVIYTINGREVTCLFDGEAQKGHQEFVWNGSFSDGRKAPSGLYFVRLKSDGRSLVERIALVK